MLGEYFCNPHHTVLYSLIYAVVVGIIFSAFTCSLAIILFFVVLMEAIVFSVNPYRYFLHIRLVVVLSYLAGWIIGRTVFEQEYCFVSWDYDTHRKGYLCDEHCSCHKQGNRCKISS